jgi:hypothetical protein
MASTPQTGRARPVSGVEAMAAKRPLASARSPGGPERSGGAPKALDSDGAIGPTVIIAQLSARHRNPKPSFSSLTDELI